MLTESQIIRSNAIANRVLIVFTALLFCMFIGYAWWMKQLAGMDPPDESARSVPARSRR
jgi:hypothetical protein